MLRSPTTEKCQSESDIAHLLDTDLEPEPSLTRGKRRRVAAAPLNDANSSKLDQILGLMTKQNSRLDDLESHIRDLKSQSSTIQSTNTDIVKSVGNVTEQLSLMQTKIDGLESRRQDMCVYLNKLDDKIERFERNSVKTTVEIRQVPKQVKEDKDNLYKVFKNLTNTLGLPLDKREVRDIYRQPSKATDTKSTVVVEFCNTFMRTDFLSIAKKRNKSARLCTKDLGLDGEQDPIFISEHLTSSARRLHFLARNVAKSCHFAFCWTANGQVFLRKEEGSALVFVKSEEQLNKMYNELKQ